MGKINGMVLCAIDENNQKIERFKVVWLGDLAFGEINSNTTDKKFLELYCPDHKQLQAELERLRIQLKQYEKDSAELLERHGVDPDDKVDREDLKRMLNYLIGINKRLKEKHRWIPVSERLPEKNKEVELAFGQTRPVFGKRVDISKHKYTEWENVSGFPITATVTHWKPIILPEALKDKDT